MSKAKILIVEDEPIVGLELSETLAALGYEALPVVTSGDAVLGAVATGSPDLIIMDIHLKSFTDGIDAGQRLRLFRDIPIVYITAYSNEDMKERALRTKPAAYLLKPVEESVLRETIERSLPKRGA